MEVSSETLLDEIIEYFADSTGWCEKPGRFVIIEKFEHNKYKIGQDNNSELSYIRFLNGNGEMHRNNDNPSFISKDTIMWHKNGKLHRKDDYPAIKRIGYYNSFTWSGIQNREDFFIQKQDGLLPVEEYFINGIRDRKNDLPAVIYKCSNTYLMWYKNDVLHRVGNKPAIINGNFIFFYKEGELYKSDITFNNTIIDWIFNNPFKLATGIFVILALIACF